MNNTNANDIILNQSKQMLYMVDLINNNAKQIESYKKTINEYLYYFICFIVFIIFLLCLYFKK